jgi:hypothetical protein
LLARCLVTAAGTQRRPGVVGHLAGPHEIPQSGQRELGLEPGRSDEVVPELGAASECGADLVVLLAFRPWRCGGTAECRRILTEEDGDPIESCSHPHDFA